MRRRGRSISRLLHFSGPPPKKNWSKFGVFLNEFVEISNHYFCCVVYDYATIFVFLIIALSLYDKVLVENR